MFKANKKMLSKLKIGLLEKSRNLKLLKRPGKKLNLTLNIRRINTTSYKLKSLNSRRPLKQPLM